MLWLEPHRKPFSYHYGWSPRRPPTTPKSVLPTTANVVRRQGWSSSTGRHLVVEIRQVLAVLPPFPRVVRIMLWRVVRPQTSSLPIPELFAELRPALIHIGARGFDCVAALESAATLLIFLQAKMRFVLLPHCVARFAPFDGLPDPFNGISAHPPALLSPLRHMWLTSAGGRSSCASCSGAGERARSTTRADLIPLHAVPHQDVPCWKLASLDPTGCTLPFAGPANYKQIGPQI
ncbi:hypothetical protein C8F04DRAFT_1191028 [Mycena alexandri]|uniref:Uncharacterized protein n=1 Tax=Mycena alexandri TaxID=1745969 RepID=A0AAD6SE68_9AGAR|nr:hypothetical protein C8F04DRAFT_1191028 [Mycena alexandri]